MTGLLDRLAELREVATPGPWEPDGSTAVSWERDLVQATSGTSIAQHVAEVNAALIVAAVNALPTLLRIARAAEAYREAADWYRRCLEGVIDRMPVRGLAEARVGFDAATDELRSALASLGDTPT